MKFIFPALCWLIPALGIILACAKKPAAIPTEYPKPVPTVQAMVVDTSEMKVVDPVTETAIYFELNSSEVNMIEGWAVKAHADYAKLTAHKILLTGHACPLGEEGLNHDLGMRRARAVEALLISEGVNPGRITVESWGESTPITVDPLQFDRNRRVQITYTGELK